MIVYTKNKTYKNIDIIKQINNIDLMLWDCNKPNTKTYVKFTDLIQIRSEGLAI